MENQTNTNNNKKKLAILVALIVVALAVVAVFVSRGQQGDVAEPTATPEEVTTDAPEVTDEPEATEEPVVTEEPATEEPVVTEVPATEEPVVTEVPATEEPVVTEEPATEEPVVTEEPAAEEPVETEAQAAATDEPETAEASAEANPGDVMVLVNGAAVSRADVEDYRSYLISYFSQQNYDMTDEEGLKVVGEIALNAAIEDAIIAQKIIDLGLDLTDEERAEAEAQNAEEWARSVDLYAQSYFGLTDESTEEEAAEARLNAVALLEGVGYTESWMLEGALENMRFEKIYAYIVADAEVTDADIQAAFDAHVAEDQARFENDIFSYEFMTQYYGYTSFYTPAGYRGVTHILLEVDDELMNNWQALTARLEEQQDEDELTDAEEAEAGEDAEPTAEPVTQEQVDAAYAAILASVQPTIDEIYAKLEEGVPFADLVAEYGTDPGMNEEPTKTEGYPVHMDSFLWDPAFVAGAFSVDEVGAVADPVVGNYGVHIIQYTRDIPAGAVEMTEEMQAAILDEVMGDKESELYRRTMDGWLEEAEIVYSEEAQAMRSSRQEAEE